MLIWMILLCCLSTCSDDDEIERPPQFEENTQLKQQLAGNWVAPDEMYADSISESFRAFSLNFDSEFVHWYDSTSHTYDKETTVFVQTGFCQVKYAFNDGILVHDPGGWYIWYETGYPFHGTAENDIIWVLYYDRPWERPPDAPDCYTRQRVYELINGQLIETGPVSLIAGRPPIVSSYVTFSSDQETVSICRPTADAITPEPSFDCGKPFQKL